MFFKKLELFGFKSFNEKTKLDFEAGVTAIVGPNGCGKSNVADAVRWVLGEQSVRSMRGSRMEDVIFHGAENIPPVGFAEVSLTISNHNNFLPIDYQEVTITRRIYRSGESEYLVNKVPVRLKDIQELLMGTGLGIHSYSIMEQGKVDQILSSKPEGRRAIFEEASGITKYKTKKEEALRKLERTNENLQRLADIIVEVRRQIKSIERQVNKARQYKQEFEKLKGYELQVSQFEYKNVKTEKETLENKSKELDNIEATLSAKMHSVVHSLEKVKHDLSCVEENISNIQTERYQLDATITTASHKITLSQERIEELSRRKNDLEQQILNVENRRTVIVEQIKEAQNQIETLEQKRQTKSSAVEEKEENINKIADSIKETQKKISEDKMQQVETIAQATRVKNNLTKQEANLANFSARLRRLNVEAEKVKEELAGIEEKYHLNTEEYGLLNLQLKQLSKEIWDLRSNLEIKLERQKKLALDVERIAHQITSLRSQLNFLKELTKNYEGFSRGVKSILQAFDNQKLHIEGFWGVVANLIKVLPQYQIAIEAALGENAQSIVVENIQVASAAIDYLKSKEAGRANFICLDSIKADNVKCTKLEQTLGAALEFVQVESRYLRLMEYLLGNIFVVPDLGTAHQILKDTKESLKLVSLNGEMITRTSIVGGSLPKNLDSSLLGRRERIAQIENKLTQKENEKREMENLALSRETEIKELNYQIRHREPELDKLKIKVANKEAEKGNIETDKKRFQDELSIINLEREETNEQIGQLQVEQENLNQEFTHLKSEQHQLQDRIQNNQELISGYKQKQQNILVEIAQTRTEVSALGREIEQAQTRLQMIIESETEQKKIHEEKKKEVQGITTKTEQLKQEIAQLQLQSKELSVNKQRVQTQLKQVTQRRQQLSEIIRSLEASVRENQMALDDVRNKKARLQVKLTELSYKLDSLKERMLQNYQVDLELTLQQVSNVAPVEAFVFEEINKLKVKLEGMGPINLVAIEENDQLQQRYDFLISQQEDLIKAQASLRKAIVQINHTARQLFAQTFHNIKLSFRDYFRILFSGGDARLILLDENNILECGIEIVVRPPGKKLQNISLLSGGEKALTAIALLFAIFKVKPSPFCILDEVDAPLDEANVERFTNLLSEFIKTSQFIVITHNKKTINMADVMYGVTMEKAGVSKIVSVKFSEEKRSSVQEVTQLS
jgi:chromosome segregation protein